MPRSTFMQSRGLGSPAGGAYSSSLSRWLKQQKQAQAQFTAAAEPLRESIAMFQPGGGYGRGQELLLREEARKAGAEATASQVASGMSSGSLATGTGLRIKRDLATGLAGVEDVRTQFLNQVRALLSNLLGTQAQTTAGVTDPSYAPYMSGLANADTAAARFMSTSRSPTPSIFGQPPSASTLKEQARYAPAPTPTPTTRYVFNR